MFCCHITFLNCLKRHIFLPVGNTGKLAHAQQRPGLVLWEQRNIGGGGGGGRGYYTIDPARIGGFIKGILSGVRCTKLNTLFTSTAPLLDHSCTVLKSSIPI
jgi:hypothetical protein